MPRNYQPVEFNTFVGGLVTEASPLNFPTNASLDEENFVLNKDGTRSRRLGMQFEPGYQIINSSSSLVNGDLITSSFKWSNAGGLSTNTIICVQMGSSIDFFRGNAETISITKFYTYTFSGLDPIERFSYASVDGKLIVANGQKQIAVFQYDTSDTNPATAISVSFKTLLIRDLFGLDDGTLRSGTDISTRPYSATGNHIYNLRNQGWATPRPKWGGDDSKADVIEFFVSKAAGQYPSNADNITAYVYANTDSQAGSKTVDRFDVQNMISNPPANTDSPIGYFIIDALDRGNSRKAAISNLASKYPMNSGSLNSSVLAALKLDQTNGGPKCVCEFGGRIWYSGFEGEVTDGDLHSPKMSSYLLFSRLVTDESDINLCYQAADPTDPTSSDLVDTDGGFIRVEGAYNIIGMAVLQSTMFVLAENGIWSVSGGSGSGFTATNYQVNKVTGSGCISKGSVVIMQDSIFYWGMDGIYAITRNEFGDFKSNNITNKTIKRFYMAIPDDSIRRAEGVYDSYDGYVKWLYNNYLGADDDPIELNLDVNSGAYFKLRIKSLTGGYPLVIKGVPTDPYRISSTVDNVVDSSGNNIITSDSSNVIVNASVRTSGLKEIVYLTLTDDSHYTFSGYTEPFHFDWTDIDGIGIDAYAYLLTGVLSGGDYQRGKQIVYQTTHFGKTETGTVPLIYTSRPYPLYNTDSMTLSPVPESGYQKKIHYFISDGMNFGISPVSGNMDFVKITYTMQPESMQFGISPQSGNLVYAVVPVIPYSWKDDGMQTSISPLDGLLKRTLIIYSNWPPDNMQMGISPTSGSLGLAGDPNWSSVVSLLHFNGTDGSTTITDQKGLTWTVTSNSRLATAQSKFGTSSIINSTGNILGPTSVGTAIGTGDYTIEMWLYPTSNSSETAVLTFSAGPVAGMFYETDGTITWWESSVKRITSTDTAPLNTWTSVAITRTSGTVRMFINGVLQASTYTSSTDLSGNACRYLNENDTLAPYVGYVDEARITSVSRYTTSYTPSTSQFPDS